MKEKLQLQAINNTSIIPSDMWWRVCYALWIKRLAGLRPSLQGPWL